jgi:hypothetical protein
MNNTQLSCSSDALGVAWHKPAATSTCLATYNSRPDQLELDSINTALANRSEWRGSCCVCVGVATQRVSEMCIITASGYQQNVTQTACLDRNGHLPVSKLKRVNVSRVKLYIYMYVYMYVCYNKTNRITNKIALNL